MLPGKVKNKALLMVVMSNNFPQATKGDLDHLVYQQQPQSGNKVPFSTYPTSSRNPLLESAGHSTDQSANTAQINTAAMPEPSYVQGGYYPNSNNTGFPVSYPTNFSQPAPWSTGNSNQPPPQSFDHAAFGYSGLNAQAQGSTDSQQYMAADHLFSQNTSAYQSTLSAAPYFNGNWSYFNTNSFFFPTGNGDLNLSWGTAPASATENPVNTALLQDLYNKPLLVPEQEKAKIEELPNELSGSMENGEMNSTETVEHALSNLSVTTSSEPDVVDLQQGNDSPIVSSVTTSVPLQKPPPPSDPIPAPVSTGTSNAPAKPVSWAAVASQPAKTKPIPKKPQPKPAAPAPASTAKSNYSSQNGIASNRDGHSRGSQHNKQQQQGGRWGRQSSNSSSNSNDTVARDNDSHLDINSLKDNSPLLKKLMTKYNFNPREFSMNLQNCRFFIIKSYSEDDIFRSIKYSSWTSTEHGNRRLNDCYKETQRGSRGPVYLLFSVNSSGHFCGVAEMMSEVDINVETGIWVQDKWKGRFDVRWIYVKDVPNNSLRHIRLENNENKPVTNSRDTQEVPFEKGKQILKIIHNYKAQTSIFDDFSHYEKRQEEDAKMRSKKMPEPDL